MSTIIPEDWEIKTLGSVINLQRGFDLPYRNRRAGYVPVVTSSGSNDTHDEAKVKAPGVVTGRYGTIGEIFFITRDFWPHNTTLFVSDFKGNEPLFIYYLLDTIDFETYSGKSGVPGINRNDLHQAMVCVPSRTSEQRAIADALSDVDDQIAALDALIAKKRDIKQGAMQRLLSGEERLPGFSREWRVLSLANHATLKARIGWQGLTTAEYLDSGEIYLVTGTDFVNGRIDWNNCHFVDEHRYEQDKNIQLRVSDVLITKDGTIGKVAYIDSLPANATLNSGVFVIRPNDADFYPLFLYYILNSTIFSSFLAQLQAGSTINHLYQKDFIGFAFSAPFLDEQEAISTMLSDMDSTIEALEAERKKIVALKQGMMQELLTGKTRLI